MTSLSGDEPDDDDYPRRPVAPSPRRPVARVTHAVLNCRQLRGGAAQLRPAKAEFALSLSPSASPISSSRARATPAPLPSSTRYKCQPVASYAFALVGPHMSFYFIVVYCRQICKFTYMRLVSRRVVINALRRILRANYSVRLAIKDDARKPRLTLQ
jgi:hypothetical protein